MTVSLPYWRLSGFYFFYFALLGATAPFLGLYFDHMGFSPERIGELIAIPMLMRCVAPNLWGWLGDATVAGWKSSVSVRCAPCSPSG